MNINFQEEIDLLAKVRVVLGNINIEAKSAGEVVTIDHALTEIMESLTKKNEQLRTDKCENCENCANTAE
jgi:hypothetical protein